MSFELKEPKYTLIEKTALELAAATYEMGRSKGMTSIHQNAREYAKANLKRFIPNAVSVLNDMLGMNHISEHMKNEIYEALLERANDTDLDFLNIKNPDKSMLDLELDKIFGKEH